MRREHARGAGRGGSRAPTRRVHPRAPPARHRGASGAAAWAGQASPLRLAPRRSVAESALRAARLCWGKEDAAARAVWSGDRVSAHGRHRQGWPRAPGPAPDRGACASPAARPGRGRWRLGVASPRSRLFLFLFRRWARAGFPARGAAPLVAHFGRAWRGPAPSRSRSRGHLGRGCRRGYLGGEARLPGRRSPGPRDEGPGRDSRRSQAGLRPPGARRWAFGFCFLSGDGRPRPPRSPLTTVVCAGTRLRPRPPRALPYSTPFSSLVLVTKLSLGRERSKSALRHA